MILLYTQYREKKAGEKGEQEAQVTFTTKEFRDYANAAVKKLQGAGGKLVEAIAKNNDARGGIGQAKEKLSTPRAHGCLKEITERIREREMPPTRWRKSSSISAAKI